MKVIHRPDGSQLVFDENEVQRDPRWRAGYNTGWAERTARLEREAWVIFSLGSAFGAAFATTGFLLSWLLS